MISVYLPPEKVSGDFMATALCFPLPITWLLRQFKVVADGKVEGDVSFDTNAMVIRVHPDWFAKEYEARVEILRAKLTKVELPTSMHRRQVIQEILVGLRPRV